MYEQVERITQRKKLTQEELASEIGVSKITILRWENGERQIKPDKAQALANHFGVSVAFLFGFADNPKQYDDEEVVTQQDGTVWAYSEKRDKDRDFQTFVNCLKELQVVISDKEVKSIFNLIQSMNLNNEGNFWGDYIAYDVTMLHEVDDFYNDMARNGYSLLIEDTSKGTKELRLFDTLPELSED